jgi:hypothetical protein
MTQRKTWPRGAIIPLDRNGHISPRYRRWWGSFGKKMLRECVAALPYEPNAFDMAQLRRYVLFEFCHHVQMSQAFDSSGEIGSLIPEEEDEKEEGPEPVLQIVRMRRARAKKREDEAKAREGRQMARRSYDHLVLAQQFAKSADKILAQLLLTRSSQNNLMQAQETKDAVRFFAEARRRILERNAQAEAPALPPPDGETA